MDGRQRPFFLEAARSLCSLRGTAHAATPRAAGLQRPLAHPRAGPAQWTHRCVNLSTVGCAPAAGLRTVPARLGMLRLIRLKVTE